MMDAAFIDGILDDIQTPSVEATKKSTREIFRGAAPVSEEEAAHLPDWLGVCTEVTEQLLT
jgi:hypothetical protein